MPFSEHIKLKVKRRAAFRCCRCQTIGVDVHHIVPESEGGPNTFNNAAPLCQNCHNQIGHNTTKRKEIRQMRDWWYEVCGNQYAAEGYPYEDKINDINNTLINIQKGQEGLIPNLVGELRDLFDQSVADITSPTSALFATGIVASSTGILGQVLTCRECGRSTTVLTDGLCYDCYNKEIK